MICTAFVRLEALIFLIDEATVTGEEVELLTVFNVALLLAKVPLMSIVFASTAAVAFLRRREPLPTLIITSSPLTTEVYFAPVICNL